MTTSHSEPTVVLSIETAARELDSKVVLAAALAGRGCRVVVAHKEAATAIAARSRRVVWHGKSLFAVRGSDHLADRLAANGSAIMFMSDEGALYQAAGWGPAILQKHWVGHFAGRRLDRMCVWGRRQGELIAGHLPEAAGAIAVTGSARFDLCLPEYAWITDPIRDDRYPGKPFVLVCTRFGSIAHANGPAAPFAARLNAEAWPTSVAEAEIGDVWFRKWRRDVHDFAEFTVFIRELATTYPTNEIVVRPHPSESLDFYRGAFAALKNIRVERGGSLLGWMRAAAVVVHSGSTSGVEATLAERPVVNFLPDEGRGDDDIEVAREAGVTVHSRRDAVDAVARLLADGAPPQSWSDRAKDVLENLDHPAIPRLVEETMAVLREDKIDASELVLPRESPLRTSVRRWTGRSDTYVEGKRGLLDAGHIERILAGCAERHIGGGRIARSQPHWVVIAPP